MARPMSPKMLLAAVLVATACSSNPKPDEYVPPEPIPFPSMAFSGQAVALFPLTLMVSEEELGWEDTTIAISLEQWQEFITSWREAQGEGWSLNWGTSMFKWWLQGTRLASTGEICRG